jgi:hypothetical protein
MMHYFNWFLISNQNEEAIAADGFALDQQPLQIIHDGRLVAHLRQ